MKKIFLTVVFLLMAIPAMCANLTIQWNPESQMDFYEVYQRTANTEFSAVWSGQETSVTIDGLDPNETYIFAVKAFDFNGCSGVMSDEIVSNMPEEICTSNPNDTKVTGCMITSATK